MTDVKSTIFQTVAETGKVDAASVNGETRLTEDLKLKSVDKIGISAILSTKFGVTITMFDILKVKKLDELVTLVEAKMKK